VWGAPTKEQKRLAPLLAGLEKQRRAFMFEMTRDVPWVGTRMLAEPVSVSDIAAQVSKTTHSDLKNSRVVAMRPENGYISLVRCSFCF